MTHKIKVQMFGNFRMDYNGAPFVAEKMHKESQFNRMMQALIHYSDCGIAKDKLEEIVIGERDIDEPHTALRVIVYKTKQKLAQLGLPGKNLIYLEGGIYYWTPDIEIEEDAAEFEKLYNEACALEKQMPQESESAETVCDERIKEIEDNMLELYVKALYLYKGEFLVAYTGETWIAQEARRYHTMFEKIINEAAYILRKRKQFKGLEKIGVYAAKVDPFNEWEELIMEAMVETRRYDEAEELYTDVVDYYLRECGIYPSSRLLEILEKYSNQMNHAHEILENIQEGMNEQEETERGGYFCSYPVFKGIYQASIRIMKRTRVPVYLMLCTLEDEEGRQVQSETKMNKYSRQLKKCVGESIRYSDIYTSYGKVQFLIMLIGIKREDCEIVKKRINRQFAKKNPRAAEKCHVNSIVYRILVLGYSPNFRHFLHRQGMYRSKYWSCFDAIAQVRRKKVAVLSYHDIKWPKGLEFVYSPFSIIALQGDVKYAQVEFGEDGNPISIDMFEDGKICRRNYYDDRGFVSSTVIYENGIEQYQDFLMENGIWKIREYKNDGHVVVNQTCPDYDVVPDAKSGKAGEPVEMRFTKAEYDSLEAVIEEVFASYVNLTRQNDNFFVAMHPLHIRVAEHVLKGKRIIATFFENRFDFTQTSLAADFLEHAENIITDSDYTTKLIMENLGAVNNKPVRLNITDIPPYDTRMDFGISSQLRVQNILVPVDGLTEDAFARIIKGLADYLTINDLARVHFFTRDASWGHEDAIKNDTVKLLDSMGYDSRLVTGDGEAALGFGGSGADAFAENELGDIEKTVEQRFFVDVCVDERDISKCINEQRVILDMRGTMDVFVYVTAISKGVPRISLSADQFLVSGKNGMVIDDFSDIGRSLTYYLDSFENWNQALVECYELGQKYTTSVLLKKWRKVLNFSE